jgi:TatD DNase family protein
MLIDSHAHLQDPHFSKDLSLVLKRARRSGVESMICISDRIESSYGALRLASSIPDITAAVGIHPHHADTWTRQVSSELESLASPPGVVAIGEIGLDHYWPGYDADQQVECFIEQARLAAKLDKPIVIHCRDAYETLIDVLSADSSLPHRGVIHCFGGTADQAQRLTRLGYHLGIGGSITYPSSADLRGLVGTMGLNRMLIETDAPYLTPQCRQGCRNEPGFILDTLAVLAESAGTSEIHAADQTRSNTIELFQLDHKPGPPTHEGRIETEPERRPDVSLIAGNGGEPFGHGVTLTWPGEPGQDWERLIVEADKLKSENRHVILEMHGPVMYEAIPNLDGLSGLIDTLIIQLDDLSPSCFNTDLQQQPRDPTWNSLLELTKKSRQCIPDIIIEIPVGSETGPAALRRLVEDQLEVRFMPARHYDENQNRNHSIRAGGQIDALQ